MTRFNIFSYQGPRNEDGNMKKRNVFANGNTRLPLCFRDGIKCFRLV